MLSPSPVNLTFVRCQAQSRLQSTLEELSGVLLSNTQQEKDLRGAVLSVRKR